MTTTSTKPFAPDSDGKGWLAALENQQSDRHLWSLPDTMSDPFANLAKRLQTTLESFRYSDQPSCGRSGQPALPRDPRKLLDWAIAQTGLTDPMTKHSRHEIEQAFQRYARDRDQLLVEMAREAKRSGDHHVLHEAAKHLTNPIARLALADAIRAS